MAYVTGAVALLLAVSCAPKHRESVFPDGFTFIGVPIRIESQVFNTIDGPRRRIILRVVKVTKGTYREHEAYFDFADDAPPPLEIGARYQFVYSYGYGGLCCRELTKLPSQNEP
jgi:hypothetical protein